MATDLLKESFDWIKNNPNSSQLDIPEHLLNFWLVEDLDGYFNSIDINQSYKFSVFMYAFMVDKIKTDNYNWSFEIEESILIDLFISWQIILSTAEVSLKTDINIWPIKIFDFSKSCISY